MTKNLAATWAFSVGRQLLLPYRRLVGTCSGLALWGTARLAILSLLLLALLGTGPASAADWAKNFSGLTGANTITMATAVDATNTYIAGYFSDSTLTLGSVTLTRIGAQDAFVAKLDASGTVLWAKNYGGSGATAQANAIAVDGSGNVHLGGQFLSGNLTTPALTLIGIYDAFALKLDSSGTTTWAKNFGGSGANVYGNAIAVDGSGNVYLGGYFYTANLTSPALTLIGSRDAFTLKLDSSGTTTWAKNFGGSGANVYGNAIAVDGSSNVYLGGQFTSANLTSPVLTKRGTTDAFAIKLTTSGTTTWAQNFGGTGVTANGNAIAVDGSGNVVLAGYFSGNNMTTPVLTKAGSTDAFALQLDPGGTPNWAKNFGVSGATTSANAIAVDTSGNVYLGGYFQNGNIIQIGDIMTPALTRIGTKDAFAFKLASATGATTWSKNYGGSGAQAQANGIAIDASGNVVLGGSFRNASLTTPALALVGANDAFAFKLDSSGATTWAKSYGGLAPPGSDVKVAATAVDAAGNTYIAGNFSSSALQLGSVTLSRIGSGDSFVAKLDTSGTVLWAKNFGGSTAGMTASAIAVDASGNVYLGGYFSSASLTTPALTLVGNLDAFAIKLDASGATTWAKSYGASNTDTWGYAIAVDSSGNVYLGGQFRDRSGSFSANLAGMTVIGNMDAFALKLDASGATTWAKNFGGSNAWTSGAAIAVDASGNVYLGGQFKAANLTTPVLTKVGYMDAFTVKLDASGATTWAKNFGGDSVATVTPTAIAVDSSGNVYLGGYFLNDNLTPLGLTKIGRYDAFAFKLSSSGSTTWVKNFGGSDGATVMVNGIAVDGSGNVYLGGYFQDANLTTPALTQIGDQDALALKLNASGTVTWSQNYGGIGAMAQVNGFALDASGNIYMGGYFSGANLTTPALTKGGSRDALLMRVATLAAVVVVPVVDTTPAAPTETPVGPGGNVSLGSLPVVSQGGGTINVPSNSSGGTITLQIKQSDGSTAQASTLQLGSQTLSIQAVGSNATFSVHTTSYLGKSLLMIDMVSGITSFTAPSSTPFLVFAGNVVNSGSSGSKVNMGKGKLAIRNGSVSLNTINSASGNAYSADSSITAYAGEVIEQDASGKLTIRVGSLSGTDGDAGDALPAQAGLPAAVKLSGQLGRLGNQSPLDILSSRFASSVGSGSIVQNANGSVGPSINALPESITIDASRADGTSVTNGRTEVAKNGLVISLIPLLANSTDFTQQIDLGTGIPGSWLVVQSDAALILTVPPKQYAVRVGMDSTVTSAADGMGSDDHGNLVWNNKGVARTLYPVLRHANQLNTALLAIDPKASLIDNGNGSYSITLMGQTFSLRPRYDLINFINFPAGHSTDAWWVDSGMLYINYGALTAQGIAVQ